MSRKVGRFLKLLAVVVSAIGMIFYLFNARSRWLAGDWESESSKWDDGRYIAKYARLGNHLVLLRIYDAKKRILLAERTYQYFDAVKLEWYPGELVYSTNDSSPLYDGGISLPPTKMDNILAYLP